MSGDDLSERMGDGIQKQIMKDHFGLAPPGHSKEVVDGFNAIDKRFLQQSIGGEQGEEQQGHEDDDNIDGHEGNHNDGENIGVGDGDNVSEQVSENSNEGSGNDDGNRDNAPVEVD